MKKLFLVLTSLAMLSSVLSSCGRRVIVGRGDVVQEGRIATSFDKVEIEAPVHANIHIKPGATPSVALSGYKNLLEHIETSVQGGKLTIRMKDGIDLHIDKDLTAEITVASLSELELHGSSDADVKGKVSGNRFQLAITGTGDVDIEDVQVGEFKTRTSGAGNLHINKAVVNSFSSQISGVGDVEIDEGRCGKAEYKVSGAGSISSFGFRSEHVTAKVSGTGDMDLYATKTLDARVSGAGTIRYKGSPVVKSESSGVGEVVAAN